MKINKIIYLKSLIRQQYSPRAESTIYILISHIKVVVGTPSKREGSSLQ